MMQRLHKNKVDFNTQDFYRGFLRKYKIKITQREYTLILKTFFEIIIKKIVIESFRFMFPRVGLFYLTKIKQEIVKDKNGKVKIRGSINWPETKKLMAKTGDKTKVVRYLNDHTNRYIFKIMWDKSSAEMVNKYFYTFKQNKKHKEFLHNIIMNSEEPLNGYKVWYQ